MLPTSTTARLSINVLAGSRCVASWRSPGARLGSSWAHFGACWSLVWGPPLTFSFGSLGGPPGAILDRVGHGWAPDSPLHEFKDRLFGALLGCSWVAPGRFGGRLGAFLGPSSGIRGPSWNHLEASKVHCKRKRENAYNGEAHRKEAERERALAREVEASHRRFEGQQVWSCATDAARSGQVNRQNTIFSTEAGVASWGTCAVSAREKTYVCTL